MSLLLTGATGFVGKVVLLDIINHFQDKVDTVYVLVRSNKRMTAQERVGKIMANEHLAPFFKTNVITVDGDMTSADLGISCF